MPIHYAASCDRKIPFVVAMQTTCVIYMVCRICVLLTADKEVLLEAVAGNTSGKPHNHEEVLLQLICVFLCSEYRNL